MRAGKTVRRWKEGRIKDGLSSRGARDRGVVGTTHKQRVFNGVVRPRYEQCLATPDCAASRTGIGTREENQYTANAWGGYEEQAVPRPVSVGLRVEKGRSWCKGYHA